MKILVIGLGYIGISTALYFTKAGFQVHGIDSDLEKLALIRKGEMPQKDLEEWLNFKPKKYLKKLKVSHLPTLLKDNIYDAIFVAIPTEKDGEPYFEPLENVIETINESKNKDTLTIIESTLTPGIADKYIEPYLKNFAIAPRRDWFTEKDKTIETLPRVVGGNTIENTKKASGIIGKVCKEIHTCNYEEAQLVKACENSLRHIGAVFAQQLAWAYPNIDTRKVLKLASSKWNIPEYFANIIGTSGYCIPVSSKYVMYGATNEEHLTILRETLISDNMTTIKLVSHIGNLNPKKIAILGISYLGDIKVHILSGALRFIENWSKFNTKSKAQIKVHDPLYTSKEIKKISRKSSFELKDLNKFDVIIVTADHTQYKKINKKALIRLTKNCKFILDNCAIWEDVKFKCPYIVPGRKDWLKKLKGIYNEF